MATLSSHEMASLLLALGLLLAAARICGELARRCNQPAVLGEIAAGILLGPTVFGHLAPELHGLLFPRSGALATTLDAIMTLAITLFLLVAGLEINLSSVWRQGRLALTIGLAGIVIPFTLGFGAAWFWPYLMGAEADSAPLIFALFIGTALSISALPVIAKTLMDLNLYRSDLGMMLIAAAVFNDLVGWIVFALILGMLGSAGGAPGEVGPAIAAVVAFAALMLSAGRWLIHRSLPWVQAHTSWPGGVLAFALTLALVCAAFTEWLGVHAIFGSFLAGVALGDSSHLRQRTRATITQFVSFIFAPLFFAGIGLKVNFLAHFDLQLVLAVLAIACAGKILGCGLGARLGGLAAREAWALGFGMNARGAMEIILGLLALQYGVISERLFVALVIMALVTSLMSGPAMQAILRLRKPRRFINFFRPRAFLPRLRATTRDEAIRELTAALAPVTGLESETLVQAVLERESLMPTGLGHGIAIPHARLDTLAAPLLGAGICLPGIDFDAPDGRPANLIFLLLTPRDDDGAQLEILADISRTFRDKSMRDQALATTSATEFMALVHSGEDPGQHGS